MSRLFKDTIDNLLEELHKRMEILNITMPPKEATNNYLQVADIIKHTLGKEIADLTLEDVTKFNIVDLETILRHIGFQQDALDDYLEEYEQNVIKYQFVQGLDDIRMVQDFFHRLLDTLKDYQQDYESYTVSSMENKEKNYKLYQKYIDLFSHNDGQLFEDFSELRKMLSSLGIAKEEQWQILSYLASQNIENIHMDAHEIDEAFKINREVAKYLVPENPVLEAVQDYVQKNQIDIDHLDFTACDFAANYSLDYDIVYDTLVAIVLNDLKKNQKGDLPTISSLLTSFIPIRNDVLKKAWALVTEKQDFLTNSMAMIKRDIYDYLDLSLKEIVADGVSLEEAIDLKSLPILKTLVDSLKKADSLSPFSEDYALSSDIIAELLGAYDNLMAKRENSKEY